MSNKVVVVDYGIGNVFSVCNALKQVDADVTLSRDPAVLKSADRLILPGVGAFGRAMEALKTLNLVEHLTDYCQSGRPFLGICIGMQVLMATSEEFGAHEGLGFIAGKVQRIPDATIDGKKLVVPHISWASLEYGPNKSASDWDATLLAGQTPGDASVYYVHSYHCVPDNPEHILAQSQYGGHKITAAIKKDNITGLQFHPEKSGKVGLGIIRDFLKS